MLICLDQRTGAGCGAQNRDGAHHCSQCGMPLRFALQLQNPGAVVGHYRVVRLIGHGGFGAVYEAEDVQQPGLRVALKETFDPASIISFQREFAVLRTLQHPNLPQYFEAFEFRGNGYLVMEFVPGQNLEEVMVSQPGQPLLESQVLGYAMQLCDALSYLHSLNPPIFHRDIKPANIRITPAGLIKLVDFGLVKQGTGTTQSSRRGLTPAYAPIEQYGMIAGTHTDARSDLYALGATLYHLLSGREPIAAVDRIAVNPDPLPALSSVNSRVSSNVANAVMTALSLQQQNRQADAGTLKQQLMGTVHPQPRPLPVRSTPPRSVMLVVAFLAITGVPALLALGAGAIGILAAILLWSGKKWGRRIGIVYIMVGSIGVGIGEISYFITAYYSLTPAVFLLAGSIATIIFTIAVFALLALFRDDVLDFFYPHHVPHASWINLCLFIVSIVAWAQILLGFWLVFPAFLGFGLLRRKRWALKATLRIAIIGAILGALAFLPGVVFSTNTGNGFVAPLFAHLTFLVNGITWYVLTRPGVDAQFP